MNIFKYIIVIILIFIVLLLFRYKTTKSEDIEYEDLINLSKDDIIKYFDKKANKKLPRFPREYPEIPKDKGEYSSIGERYCLEFMNHLFPGHKFTKVRPEWLKNPKTGKNLELDGYNEELKLAIEYNGMQHYIWPNNFHKTYEQFLEQQERDKIKEKLCKLNNVHLIIIPYTVELKNIPIKIYHSLINIDL